MDELNLFIEHYSKYIVSIIWQRYILTLHLSHNNCPKSGNASLPALLAASMLLHVMQLLPDRVIPNFLEM